ncbi:DUF4148 domain-containing protein [Paraburkholderia dinghuensis]|uniref:DUF4148 domain-containing protein n=1 Tax=Paraburkholderia dinghuensis TaxID=2305225 RepID=A0A3N6PS27_9BURK|nr:DUF4148 domain-containing protein [Paraburkholderia dinghuensis]RQH04750.1 DUF4148 domain-containing protein [Paraburkholderia dinghuensis]
MKSLIAAALAATVLAAPALSFAQQSQQPVTRAQLRAELADLEKVGYKPGLASPYYPQDIQAAMARVAANKDAAQATAYGAPANAATQAGVRENVKSVYFGH